MAAAQHLELPIGERETALLVRAGDVVELADAFAEVLGDARAEYGAAAQDEVDGGEQLVGLGWLRVPHASSQQEKLARITAIGPAAAASTPRRMPPALAWDVFQTNRKAIPFLCLVRKANETHHPVLGVVLETLTIRQRQKG